jgi:ferritin-like metal-binding protein YciE
MIGKVKSLRELFEIQLNYTYDCEKKLVEKGLPTMIESVSSSELRVALQQHLKETQNHVERLEQVFTMIGIAPATKSNDIFDKISSAVKDSISNMDESPLRDAALIVNGNTVEHYEIGMYSSLGAFAQSLGLPEVASVLKQTLSEEKAADAKLTQIGETVMNSQAAQYRAA